MSFYKKIRPLVFAFKPETAHSFASIALRMAFSLPPIRNAITRRNSIKNKNTELTICGIKFPHRVCLAAGFDKNAELLKPLSMLNFAAIEVGTITPLAQPGNPKPRLFRLPKDHAIINRMGFNNLGADKISENLRKFDAYRKKKNLKLVIGASIGKNTATPMENATADYLAVFHKVYDFVDYIAVNVSCPNVVGLTSLQNSSALSQILEAVASARDKKNLSKPIFLKISPDLPILSLDGIVEIINKNGIDGIIATNTTTKRNLINTPKEEIEKIGNGGLSGAPLTDKTIEVIHYLRQIAGKELPIIATGGIMSPDVAKKCIKAGASLVQIYTGMIYHGTGLVGDILREIY